MGKRQDAALVTRQKIIEAARELIAEKGLDNINILDITNRAGVSKGSFYTYFKHKEAIVIEITHDNFRDIKQKSIEGNSDISNKISQYLTESIQKIVDTGLKMAQDWVRNAVVPSLEFGNDKLEYDYTAIRTMLEDAQEKGEIDGQLAIHDTADWIMAEYYGSLLNWCISDGKTNPVNTLKTFSETILKSLLNRS